MAMPTTVCYSFSYMAYVKADKILQIEGKTNKSICFIFDLIVQSKRGSHKMTKFLTLRIA